MMRTMRPNVTRFGAADLAKIVVAVLIYAAAVGLFAHSVLAWID
jgi:hypothetical protein